jgi:hypothetical protein
VTDTYDSYEAEKNKSYKYVAFPYANVSTDYLIDQVHLKAKACN